MAFNLKEEGLIKLTKCKTYSSLVSPIVFTILYIACNGQRTKSFRRRGGEGSGIGMNAPATDQVGNQLFHRVAQPQGRNILMVDLNNFASFPTLAIGILIASLRSVGHSVDLVVPLAYDVPGSTREKPDTLIKHIMRRVHHTTFPGVRWARDALRSAYYWKLNRPNATTLREVERGIDRRPDLVLLSAYLMHYESVVRICALAARRGIPVIVGGPALNLAGAAERWRDIPGVTAIYGGEADITLPSIVEATIAGDDLSNFPGVLTQGGKQMLAAPPLRLLNESPMPDFSDFPWDRYPVRILPIMTGRGCQWGKCVFCSDVVSANGRTFRTRTIDNVMVEVREQSRRYGVENFLFLDLKLNSNPAVFRGIAEGIQDAAPGAQWIGTVHVDNRADNGLSRRDLKAAAVSGMRRISCGLETGSQRLLDLMDKGTTVEGNAAFVRNASEAGLSVRCTMFRGFPSETAEDLIQTAKFLEDHASFIDRIHFNDFSLPEETPIWHAIKSAKGFYPGIEIIGRDLPNARATYRNLDAGGASYRRAKARVLAAVYAINRRRLRPEAQMFDGLM